MGSYGRILRPEISYSPMHRRWWERTLAAFMAFWLAAVVAEPAFLHSCPQHDGHGAMAAPAAGAHAGHHGGAHHAVPTSDPAPTPASHGCTCLGDCGLGPNVVVPAALVAA